MKMTYDPEVEVLRILFRAVSVEESDEDKPGVIVDYDKDGNVVGIEKRPTPLSAWKTREAWITL